MNFINWLEKISWYLQIAPPYMMLLYARVNLQEKKIWAVQFTNCTALCILLCISVNLQEKKIWAVQFSNCTAQGGRAVHAPPFQVQFSDIQKNIF